MPPLKMLSHNVHMTAAQGGEQAFVHAVQMDIDLIRMDLRYRQMSTRDGWQWDAGAGHRWAELLEPSLRWTKAHGMRTLVNLIAYQVPKFSLETMNAAWREHCSAAGRRRGDLSPRKCALWVGWAAGHGVNLGAPSPRDYVDALLDRLAEGQADGDFDILGFCVLNEPNTKWPAEANWRTLRVPTGAGGSTTYTIADLCRDMCGWVKEGIAARHAATLGHTVNVVNLYSYRGHWRAGEWRRVAADPNVDVLGIDIYPDQMFGLFSWGVPEAMEALSREHGKPWWLVETGGADNPGWLWKRPSCAAIRDFSRRCRDNGAEVLGFYRSWGDYDGPLNYGGAYNIYTNPGNGSRARTDGRGNLYWETIRDI